jgi:hypothetical protein
MTERRTGAPAEEQAQHQPADAANVDAAKDAIIQKAQDKLIGAWQVEGGGMAALDPATINMIISAALQLLQFCFKKNGQQQALRAAKNPGPFQRLRARQFVKQQIIEEYGPGAWSKKDGDRIVQTMLRAGQDSADSELVEFARVEL